jgi:hypothetical protein
MVGIGEVLRGQARPAASENAEAARTGGFESRACGKAVRQDDHQLSFVRKRMPPAYRDTRIRSIGLSVATAGTLNCVHPAPGSPLAAAQRVADGISTVVLVEGLSDQNAVEALAARSGRDLAAEDVAVVPMGGATNIARFGQLFGPDGAGLTLAGLCDAGEERGFRRGLERAGLRPGPTRYDLERLGFFVCDTDLEDELIRALGGAAVEQVIAEQGELASLRILQNQPAHRGRRHEQQLHRFLGTRSGRKIHYARLLVEALDAACIPAPLEGVLAAI